MVLLYVTKLIKTQVAIKVYGILQWVGRMSGIL